MNMPPLPYLKRIATIDAGAAEAAFSKAGVWDRFDPQLMTLCSPDPQAARPTDEPANVLQVNLATNFKAAAFASPVHNAMLNTLADDIDAVRLDGLDVPVKLRVHDSLFVPFAKWPMLLTGNYRCVTAGAPISIRDAVHARSSNCRAPSMTPSSSIVLRIGAQADDLVPFDKYAAAAERLINPSSAARAIAAGAPMVERVDKLVQTDRPTAWHRPSRDRYGGLAGQRQDLAQPPLRGLSAHHRTQDHDHNGEFECQVSKDFTSPARPICRSASRQAMDVALEDHRAPDFPKFIMPLLADVKKIFQTETGHVIVFPGSGTGGWESAIANTLSPGDKVLASVFGQFSMLWVDLCQRFGLDVDAIQVDWGKGVPLDQYRAKLAADKQHAIKAVLVTHNETATGVDLRCRRRAPHSRRSRPSRACCLSMASRRSPRIDFRMDEWGVDVAVCGSQKGFMMPTGLAIVGVSEKALKAGETAKLPRCFFDYRDMLKNNAQGYFPYTPAATLLRALRASVDMLLEEGLDQCLRAPSPACRRGARRGRCLGTAQLRARPGMVLRHGHRDHGARGLRRQRRHQDGL